MAGIQTFSYVNVGKETVKGTTVAPTRQMYPDCTGVLDIDPGLDFHEGENRGLRTPIVRATQTKIDVGLAFRTSEGINFDDLPVILSGLKGGEVGVGGAADKTWTIDVLMTASNVPESYTWDVGDDTQNFRVGYVMPRQITISAPADGVTQLQGAFFGQNVAKTAKAAPAANTGIKIPSKLWTVKFAATAAGLAGASVQAALLREWQLAIDTGMTWEHYLDGNLYGGPHLEGDQIKGTLTMVVDSTSFTISEFYDKWLAQTVDFIRLKATGPVLGGTFYSAQFDMPIIYSKVQPISAAVNGVNRYAIEARMAYDATFATSLTATIVCSIAAYP
jgi:hypothetical protein